MAVRLARPRAGRWEKTETGRGEPAVRAMGARAGGEREQEASRRRDGWKREGRKSHQELQGTVQISRRVGAVVRAAAVPSLVEPSLVEPFGGAESGGTVEAAEQGGNGSGAEGAN